MYRVIKHIAFGDPDDLQRFVHPIRFDVIMAFDRPTPSIGCGDSQPDVSSNEHLWQANTFSNPLEDAIPLSQEAPGWMALVLDPCV